MNNKDKRTIDDSEPNDSDSGGTRSSSVSPTPKEIGKKNYDPLNNVRNGSTIDNNQSNDTTLSESVQSDRSNASQLRSALAIGQLIASNRPTAGSRLVASELRALNKTVRRELSSLKHELTELPIAFARALSTLNANESSNLMGAPNMRSRRAIRPFLTAMGPHRRFPVMRRPMFRLRARNAGVNQSTQTQEPARPVQPMVTSAPSSAHHPNIVIDVANEDLNSEETGSNLDDDIISAERSPIALASNSQVNPQTSRQLNGRSTPTSRSPPSSPS